MTRTALMFVILLFILVACTVTTENNPPTPGRQPFYNGQRLNGSRNWTRNESFRLPAIDYESAAAKLGISVQELKDALPDNGQRPDFQAAADRLGVTTEELRTVLGFPEGMQGRVRGTG
ncbi:MAG: hypothetical protein ABIJ34_04805 [archaeon]